MLARVTAIATPGFFLRIAAPARERSALRRQQAVQLGPHLEGWEMGTGEKNDVPTASPSLPCAAAIFRFKENLFQI